MVKPLLRKDRHWLWFFGVAGTAIHIGMQMAGNGRWTKPAEDSAVITMAFLWFAATLLGLFASVFEDLLRTREYLLHRSVSPARIFFTRVGGCALVLLAWIALAPALHLGGALLFRADSFLVEPGRYFNAVDEGTPAFVLFGIGLFAGTAVRRLIFALPLAALLSTGLVMVSLSRWMGNSSWINLPLWPVALSAAALLCWAAYRNEGEGREADMPWQARRLWLCGAILLVLVVPASSYLLRIMEQGLRETIMDVYPSVGRLQDGREILYGKPLRRRHNYQMDAQHQPVERLPADAIVSSWAVKRLRDKGPVSFGDLPTRGRAFAGKHYSKVFCGPQVNTCFIASDGLLHVIREAEQDLDARDWGDPMATAIGPGPGKTPFPATAVPVGDWWLGFAYIADPASGRVWVADLNQQQPAFTLATLPGGDRFVANLTNDLWNETVRRKIPVHVSLLIRGERGSYVTGEKGEFLPAKEEVGEAADAILAGRQHTFEATQTGPYSYELDVKSAAGSVFHHVFEPRAWHERALAGLAIAGSFLRPSAFLLVGLAAEVPKRSRPHISWFFDPFARAVPAFVLAGNLLLTLLLAGLTFARMRQVGAPSARRMFWTVAVALGSLPAYLVYRGVETSRAWKRLPVTPPAPVAPLVLLEST